MNKKTIFVSAGEVSGDIHAADVIKKIKELSPEFQFAGLGGPNMISSGMISITGDVSTMSTMGIIEAVRFLYKKSYLFSSCLKYIRKNKIKYLLLIDNQGFNIPLAKKARKLGVKSIYYFPPPVSIWGEWNTRVISENIDLIIAPFYQDYLLYKEYGGNAVFSGHPLLDKTSDTIPLREFYEKYGIDRSKKIISIMPGSRHQEIDTLAFPMLEAAKILIEKYGIQIILPISHIEFENKLLKIIKFCGLENKITIIRNDSYNAMKMADVNIQASGTASLESVLLRKPPVICYKISPFSFFVAKMLVKGKMIGLPNILLKNKFFPELLQKNCNTDNIVKEAIALLNPDSFAKQKREQYFDEIKKSLGDKNVIERVAQLVMGCVSDA